MSTEIISFDEMAEDTPFTLKGKKYNIPSISNKKAMALFKMGKNLKKAEDKSVDSADLDEQKEDDNDFMDYQNQFICAAVTNEDGSALTPEDIDEWPMRATMGIVKLINECISGKIEENTPEEKK
jgi:hypothetical protein